MSATRSGDPDSYVEHAANERTFLAWIRTALSVVAVALVLARLGTDVPPPGVQSMVTDAIAALGVVVVVGATWKYLRTRARIEAGAKPERGIPVLDLGLAAAIFTMMVALAATSFI